MGKQNWRCLHRYFGILKLTNQHTSGHFHTSRAEKGFFMNEKEITGIENAAVTNFAEMLCDYVSGLDEGEGIGREDIIDHLYEYINWDKRFTREYEEGKKNFKPF